MIDRESIYSKQAHLLLRVLPLINEDQSFALKGGTAINFFIRNLPRLSVDIDLVYIPVEPRDVTLSNIGSNLLKIADKIQRSIAGVIIDTSTLRGTGSVSKLLLKLEDAQVKVESNLIMRGTIAPCEKRELVPIAQDFFRLSTEARTISFEELYAGKICAALDRQHPRDLFDVKLLLENEGITSEIIIAFTVYLASHDRPMHELLDPNRIDIENIFESEFRGLSCTDIKFNDLMDARETMISALNAKLPQNSKEFLLSLKSGDPDWDLLGIHGIDRLPAIQWNLLNIRKMNKQKHKIQLAKLRDVLGI